MTRTDPYAAHPIAELYPMLSEEELRELARDVKAHGLRHAVVLIGNRILDGRNRALACQMADIEPRIQQYDGPTDTASLMAYVRSMNLARRHLTTSQRALIAARALPLYEEAARERQAHGKTAPGRTLSADLRGALKASEVAARDHGASPRSVEHARTVIANGAPELVSAVERGEVAVSAASELARLAKKLQVRLLAEADGDAHALRELLRTALAPPAPPPPPPPRQTAPTASPPAPRACEPATPPPPRTRPTHTTVIYDGDPGPEEEVFEHETTEPEEPSESPAAAAERAQERLARHAGAGSLAPDPRGGRLPPGDGAGFDESGPASLVAPPAREGSWRDVLGLPRGAVSAADVIAAARKVSGGAASDAKARGLSQWFSQERDADLLAKVALSLCLTRRSLRVLEPSAGEGALVKALMRAARVDPSQFQGPLDFDPLGVVAVEVDPDRLADLPERLRRPHRRSGAWRAQNGHGRGWGAIAGVVETVRCWRENFSGGWVFPRLVGESGAT